jgi:hypothetical protein
MTSSLRIAYSDETAGDVDLFDQPSGAYLTLPMPLTPFLSAKSGGGSCDGNGFDATSTPWTLCSRSDRTVDAYRVLLTSTWSIFPSNTIGVDVAHVPFVCTYDYTLGIGEQLPQDSSPFTMQSSDATIVTPNGAVSGNPHSFVATVHAKAGTATITFTDKNQRSASVVFNVTSDPNGLQCGDRPRPHRRLRIKD